MATKTRSDNNNNSQKEGGLLEKCTRMKFFPKNYKTNTKVKLKHEKKLVNSDRRRCGRTWMAER